MQLQILKLFPQASELYTRCSCEQLLAARRIHVPPTRQAVSLESAQGAEMNRARLNVEARPRLGRLRGENRVERLHIGQDMIVHVAVVDANTRNKKGSTKGGVGTTEEEGDQRHTLGDENNNGGDSQAGQERARGEIPTQ